MENLIRTTILGLVFGTFGTTLGGIIGVMLRKDSNIFLSFVLSLASGLMTAIVCFELIPEALEVSELITVLFGIICGILLMIFCNYVVERRFKNIYGTTKESLLKTGIIVSIGLAIHNFPEGLAIGSGFEASATLGYSLAIAIALHDIPEGISMAVPMKSGGMKSAKVIFYVLLSGVTTGIGALVGGIIGSISKDIIAFCLSFSAGAMLYIVSGELLPESNNLYKGKISSLGNILGFIIGILSMV